MPPTLTHNPTSEAEPSSRRILSPEERIVEVLFGLIMVITFTGSLSIAEGVAGRDDVRTMLIGALGCNLAWGIIDGVMYLMGRLAEKARSLRILQSVRNAADPQAARRIIADALPAPVAEVFTADDLSSLHQRLVNLPQPPAFARLNKRDWLGALAVFLFVFVATFPVAIPFIVMRETAPAMRTSNAVAFAMLCILGFVFGRVIDRNPWLHSAQMAVLGVILVGLTILLGG